MSEDRSGPQTGPQSDRYKLALFSPRQRIKSRFVAWIPPQSIVKGLHAGAVERENFAAFWRIAAVADV